MTPSEREAELSGVTVCIVDDEQDVRRGLEKLVSSLGADVLTAADGVLALAIVRSQPVDIVISDIRMPRMTGVDLLDAIRVERPGIEVLMMTGFGTIDLAVSCMAAGAAHFVAKPFDNHQILRVVRSIGRRVKAKRRPPSEVTMIASDPRMLEVLGRIDQVASTRLPVLIEGETGTGKELVAREIHRRGASADAPFQAVNCAALPDTLLESELFGHRAGAFTGAETERVGLFASAGEGTVFLDEVESMSSAFQAKLLRVLQNRVVRPLGVDKDVSVDFRLVAATNLSLETMADEGTFRRDLLYRLRVLHVAVPPLRERPGDIVPLARNFIERSTPDCRGREAVAPELTTAAARLLRAQPWPGNVRELESAVIRALVAHRGEALDDHHFDLLGGEKRDLSYDEEKKRAIARFQRRFVEDALATSKGNVSQAAEACGLTRAALQKIMRALEIDRERFASQ